VIEIVTIETPSLGDRTYLATDGASALVIDPQRDTGRVLAVAAARGVAVTHVFETHIHNDYVSGGLALARQCGAAYHVNAADAVAFSRAGISDGDTIAVGPSMRVRVIATPGHTFTHLAYALEDAATGEVTAVFSGGSLLHGSTGRPDLLGPEHTRTLAAAQHASARRLARTLPDGATVYPTHGFGSFCASGSAGPAGSTVGEEKRSNPALTLGEESYVTAMVEGLDAYPAYYAHMAAANAAGPDAPDPAPPARVSAGELGWRISTGEWVADLRDRRAFAAGHIPGSFSFEYGDSFATYLGWLIPWGTSLTLVGETGRQIAAAQRDLTRIGIDHLAAAAIASSAGWPAARRLATYPVSDFPGLAAARDRQDLTVLDVRRASERARGYIAGSVHVPLHELPGRLRQLPRGPLWVHCQAGYRASIAASLLHAAGHAVTAVDDDFGRAAGAGLPVAGPSGRTSAAALWSRLDPGGQMRGGQLRAGQLKPAVQGLTAGVLGFQEEQPAGRAGRAEFHQYRLEEQVSGQGVLPVPAEHQRDGGDAGQRAAGDPVQEELEQAGIGGLVGGAGHDGQITGLDRGREVGHAGVRPVQQRSAKIGEIDAQVSGPAGQSLGDEVRGLVGPGTWLRVTDHDDDAHRRLHSPARATARWHSGMCASLSPFLQ
jgi:hydroxyacylglutathione hydrolase